MIELLIAVLILCAIAYVAFTFLPAPFGTIVGVVVAIIILVWLLESLGHGAHHCC